MAQRVKHSKIKNTGILFELLSRQITVDLMGGGEKSKSVEMLKEFFNEKTELGKENQLYQVLLKHLDDEAVEDIFLYIIHFLSRERKVLICTS